MRRMSRMRQTKEVRNASSPKTAWAALFWAGPPLREDLARLVDSDGGRDESELEYFEAASDPRFVSTETAQRRFRAQLRRRLRHRESRSRHGSTD